MTAIAPAKSPSWRSRATALRGRTAETKRFKTTKRRARRSLKSLIGRR